MKTLTIVLTAVAVVSCGGVTPKQVDCLHDIYHILSDEHCIFESDK